MCSFGSTFTLHQIFEVSGTTGEGTFEVFPAVRSAGRKHWAPFVLWRARQTSWLPKRVRWETLPEAPLSSLG